MSAINKLLAHRDFLYTVKSQMSVPDRSTHIVNELHAIYKEINPKAFVDMNCPTCIFDMFKRLQAIIEKHDIDLELEAQKAAQQGMFGEAKAYKFPKQKRK